MGISATWTSDSNYDGGMYLVFSAKTARFSDQKLIISLNLIVKCSGAGPTRTHALND